MVLHLQKAVREILANLESGAEITASLRRFREIMLAGGDTALVVLVLQKVHGVLHRSYSIEHIRALLPVIRSEEAFDELFKIFSSFSDREDFAEVIAGLRETHELMLLKHLRELRDNQLLEGLVKEMDKRYSEILESIE